MLLPRSLACRPKTTVTPTFRMSQISWKPSTFLGIYHYHNNLDLGRSFPPTAFKSRRTSSTTYLNTLPKFEASKIRFQVVRNFKTTISARIPWFISQHFAFLRPVKPPWNLFQACQQLIPKGIQGNSTLFQISHHWSDKIPWLLPSKYATSRPNKPPWPYLIIHSQLTLGKARGNSCYKTIYNTWTLIRNFLQTHTICPLQKAAHHCNYYHTYLKDLSAQFYNPYGGNFSTPTCSYAILLICRFANSPSNPLIFYQSKSCNRLLTNTWNSSAQTFCHQKGSIHSSCMKYLRSVEFRRTSRMFTKLLLNQSQIFKHGDQIACIYTADNISTQPARIYQPIQEHCAHLNDHVITYFHDEGT